MHTVRAFTDEQSRLLVNLRQRYEAWIAIERERTALPYDLRRKTVGKYEYLYQIFDRSGNGKSLGNMDATREAELKAYREKRSEEHTSELQSLMRISYAVFCLKTKQHQ